MTEEKNSQEMSTVYWDPKVEITITGVELAALFQTVDLQHVSLQQLPIAQFAEIYKIASEVKGVIVERMNQAGLLFDAPIQPPENTEVVS